jgi:hypothetical protein
MKYERTGKGYFAKLVFQKRRIRVNVTSVTNGLARASLPPHNILGCRTWEN